jgi:hypothetical protein
MIVKEQRSFAAGAYAYAQIERALGAALYANTATQRGALRGRLKRLLTLGLPENGPGKGSRRRYSLEEAHQLLVALLMEDAGLDPVVVARAVKKVWGSNLARDAAAATSEDATTTNPIILIMMLQTVTGPWRTGNQHEAVPVVYLKPRSNRKAFERYRSAQYRKKGITEADAARMADEVTSGFGNAHEDEGWFVARNYTVKAVKLEDALKGK